MPARGQPLGAPESSRRVLECQGLSFKVPVGPPAKGRRFLVAGFGLEVGANAARGGDRAVRWNARNRSSATSSLLVQYQDAGEQLPGLGVRMLVGSKGESVALIEVVAVDVIRLGDADLELALDEGEGFESVQQWRAAHERFWADEVRSGLRNPASLRLDEDTRIVVERFRLLEPRPGCTR
jgi:uncharacterized protein YhfF